MNPHGHWSTKRPIPFVNASGETIPAFAVMAIRGVVYEHGIAFLQCDKANGAFVRQVAVNQMYDVPAGLRGTCFRSGDVRVLYDGGTPAAGQGWGPKPGEWSLALGYPATTTVSGVVNASAKILLGSLGEIDRVLVKTTAPVASGTTTTSYAIYAGTPGSETASGFTTVPAARNRGAAIAADRWALVVWVNSGWELREVEAGETDRVWWAFADQHIDPLDTGDVTLSTSESVSAVNWSATGRIRIGDPIFVWKDPTDELFYCIGGRQPRWFKALLAETPTFGDPTIDVVTTAALDGGAHPGAVTAANDWKCHGLNGAPCLIVENLASGGYDLVKVIAVKQTVLSTVEWNSPALERRTVDIVGMYGGAVTSLATILTAAAVELVEVVDYAKPALRYTTRNVLTFEQSLGGTETVLTTTDVVVDNDVFVAGLNLYQYKSAITVFSAGIATPSLIAFGALCLEVAGSLAESYTYSPANFEVPAAAFADVSAVMSPAFF